MPLGLKPEAALAWGMGAGAKLNPNPEPNVVPTM